MKEVENPSSVTNKFQIGILHGQLPKPQRPATMVYVSGRAKWRIQRRRLAARIKELDDLTPDNVGAGNVPYQVWGRRQVPGSKDDIISDNGHAAPRVLIHELRQIFSEKM